MSNPNPTTKKRFQFRRKPKSKQSPSADHIRPDGSRDVELPLMAHIIELRDRMIKAALALAITTGISFTFAGAEVKVLVGLAEAQGMQLISLTPTETFVAYLKVAFYTGIAASMPILVYQLFRFLAPGLTRSEKRLILTTLPAITLFFVLGVAFAYVLVLPSAIEFLFNFGRDQVNNTWSISYYLSFVTRFLLALGIAFQTPLVVFLLAKLGVATPKRLSGFRRWAYVLAFIIAAIITPTPDPVNQGIVAIPMILLYELGIIFARIGVRAPKPAATPQPRTSP